MMTCEEIIMPAKKKDAAEAAKEVEIKEAAAEKKPVARKKKQMTNLPQRSPLPGRPLQKQLMRRQSPKKQPAKAQKP